MELNQVPAFFILFYFFFLDVHSCKYQERKKTLPVTLNGATPNGKSMRLANYLFQLKWFEIYE